MLLSSHTDTPFQLQLSFFDLFNRLEQLAADTTAEGSLRAQHLLNEAAPYPELREGITNEHQLQQHEELIGKLLADYFPPGLTLNEIKAVSIPFTDIMFNYTQRFKNILSAAGPGFAVNIRDFDYHQYYVMSCCIILNEFYNTQLDFGKPLFYDIPTANGITKYYRILYNADFLEIYPTDKSVSLTPEDIDTLINSYDNLALWKEKFPKDSWILKGFAIMTLYDATVENAVSILKEKLLGINAAGFRDSIESIFQSIYRIRDLKVGFAVFNRKENTFSFDSFGQQLPSYMLQQQETADAGKTLCQQAYQCLIEKKTYFAVSEIDEYIQAFPGNALGARFYQQGIKSFILAPIVKNGNLFGVMELVSPTSKALNSINANKLQVVMPFITDTVERLASELQNQIQAVIQNKYTTVHSSVYWKFHEEAQRYILAGQLGKKYHLQEVIFPDVHPLYGQVDIKGSSEARNASVLTDLQLQLHALSALLQQISSSMPDYSFTQEMEQVNQYLQTLALPLQAATEQYIVTYLGGHIHPRLLAIEHTVLQPAISAYFANNEKHTGSFHNCRRKYETSIALINEKMAEVIDHSQTQAQEVFPHYFERFKTDGIEHNLYIGASICPDNVYDQLKLYQLRLWQLEVMIEMEAAHQQLQPSLPYALEVASLILTYHSTIDIRFRMDEKRFDVDGSYNARFEIVKKRIDKACIKHTHERITQPGKIAIVYSNETEETEYRQYICILQSRNLLNEEIEIYDVEDLQGISGLKVLRVSIAR